MFSSGTLAGNQQVSSATTNVERTIVTSAVGVANEESASVKLLVQSLPQVSVHLLGTNFSGLTASTATQMVCSVYSATQPEENGQTTGSLNYVLLDQFIFNLTAGGVAVLPVYREYDIATQYIRVDVNYIGTPAAGLVAQYVLKAYAGQ